MLSPCTKVCTVDPVSGKCVGCGRTLAEIAEWARYDDATRARIMARLASETAGESVS